MSESYSWITYARLLPWKEAESVLQPNLEDPEGARRSMALYPLILVMCHNKDASSLALAVIRRRKNELDPVPERIRFALAEMPSARIVNHLTR